MYRGDTNPNGSCFGEAEEMREKQKHKHKEIKEAKRGKAKRRRRSGKSISNVINADE